MAKLASKVFTKYPIVKVHHNTHKCINNNFKPGDILIRYKGNRHLIGRKKQCPCTDANAIYACTISTQGLVHRAHAWTTYACADHIYRHHWFNSHTLLYHTCLELHSNRGTMLIFFILLLW